MDFDIQPWDIEDHTEILNQQLFSKNVIVSVRKSTNKRRKASKLQSETKYEENQEKEVDNSREEERTGKLGKRKLLGNENNGTIKKSKQTVAEDKTSSVMNAENNRKKKKSKKRKNKFKPDGTVRTTNSDFTVDSSVNEAGKNQKRKKRVESDFTKEGSLSKKTKWSISSGKINSDVNRDNDEAASIEQKIKRKKKKRNKNKFKTDNTDREVRTVNVNCTVDSSVNDAEKNQQRKKKALSDVMKDSTEMSVSNGKTLSDLNHDIREFTNTEHKIKKKKKKRNKNKFKSDFPESSNKCDFVLHNKNIVKDDKIHRSSKDTEMTKTAKLKSQHKRCSLDPAVLSSMFGLVSKNSEEKIGHPGISKTVKSKEQDGVVKNTKKEQKNKVVNDEKTQTIEQLKDEHRLTKGKDGVREAGKKNLSLKERMTEQLKSARFRYLNECLYTQTGKEALDMFHEDTEAFHVYHEGFQSQVNKWPENPVDIIIQDIKNRPRNQVVADFGCGDAKIAQSVPHQVHSFDLVALNQYVTSCDMTHVPLKNSSVDIAVFCLSLMGTNLTDYLKEAHRVLKNGGLLKVAEVASRFTNLPQFLFHIKMLGFTQLRKDTSNKMFYLFDFKKNGKLKSDLPDIRLEPCIYKKR